MQAFQFLKIKKALQGRLRVKTENLKLTEFCAVKDTSNQSLFNLVKLHWLHSAIPFISRVSKYLFELKQIYSFTKTNLSLYSPYYAEACNEFAVPISAS